jgi:hypothetical protein
MAQYLGVEFVVIPPRNRAAAPTAALSAVADVDLLLGSVSQAGILTLMREDLVKCGWTFPAVTENNANGIARLVGDHQ